MTSITRWALALAGLGLASLATAAEPHGGDHDKGEKGAKRGQHEQGARGQGTERSGRAQLGNVRQMIRSWPDASRQAAMEMMDKYGQPASATDMQLVWVDNGPWKRTVVYREPVQHQFPVAHMDVLEQFVDYQVPAEYHDDIALYDGSVHIYRTEGEISAKCDTEAANLLALNLAHDIVEGDKTVAEARLAYGENILAVKQGQSPAPTQRLMFTGEVGQTAFRDEPIIRDQRLVGVGLDERRLEPVDLEKDVDLDEVDQQLRRVQRERDTRAEQREAQPPADERERAPADQRDRDE